MATRCNDEQRNKLVSFMEEHPELVSGKCTATFTSKASTELWKEAASAINLVPGTRKDWCGWKETWKRIKRTAKDLKSRQDISARATSGGPAFDIRLTPIQERVVALLGTTAIEDHGNNFKIVGIQWDPTLPVAVCASVAATPEEEAADVPTSNDYEILTVEGAEMSTSAPSRKKMSTNAPPCRCKVQAAEARLLRASAVKKHLAVREELLEIRKSEIELAEQQHEKQNRQAAQQLRVQRDILEAMKAQHAIANRHAEQQLSIQQRLAAVAEQQVAVQQRMADAFATMAANMPKNK